MCGRYTIRRVDLLTRFGAMEQPGFETFSELRLVPRFNVSPSQPVPVVRLNGEDARSVGLLSWGLIPHWAKAKPKLRPINARAETVATSGMFRQAFERRRCLVPADGFYEWKRNDDGTKTPYFIRLRSDELFAFAGLWERWRPAPDAEPVDTVTTITTTPNDLMRPFHDRQPVILREADHDRWLDRGTPGKDVADALAPLPAGEMEAWPVSRRVNSPRNDGADLIERESA